MRRVRILFFLIAFSFLSSHCTNSFLSPAKTKENVNLPLLSLLLLNVLPDITCNSPGRFWAQDIQARAYYCVNSEKVAEGNRVIIFKERSINPNYDYNRLVSEFDSNIYPRSANAFGVPSDIDGNGKTIILILDIRDGVTNSTTSGFVGGYVDPVNFFQDNPNSASRSNGAEMVYIDGVQLARANDRTPNMLLATIAHEYQHLIRFPPMIQINTSDDIWINEGTSEVASDISGYGPQTSRVNCFLGLGSCSGGFNGISMSNWQGSSGITLLKQYAFAYLFMKFLYENSGSTVEDRNAFFRNTVNGNASRVRGRNLTDLTLLFSSTPRISGQTAGINNLSQSELFFRLHVNFLAQHHRVSQNTNSVFRSGFSSSQEVLANAIDLTNSFPSVQTSSEILNLLTSSLPTVSSVPSSFASTSFAFLNQETLSSVLTSFSGTSNVFLVNSSGRSLLGFSNLTNTIASSRSESSQTNGTNLANGNISTNNQFPIDAKSLGGIGSGEPICATPHLPSFQGR